MLHTPDALTLQRALNEQNLPHLAEFQRRARTRGPGGTYEEVWVPERANVPCRLSQYGVTATERLRAGMVEAPPRWNLVFAAGTLIDPAWRVEVSGTIAGNPFLKMFSITGAPPSPKDGEVLVKVPVEEEADTYEEVPVGLTIFPNVAQQLPDGEQLQFEAFPTDYRGRPVPAIEVVWDVVNPLIGSITQTGLFTAITPGSTQVRARLGLLVATTDVEVRPLISSITVAPLADLFVRDDTPHQMVAEVRDAQNNIIPDYPVIWESSNPAVAPVDGDGIVYARAGSGVVRITARSFDGTSGYTDINVHGYGFGGVRMAEVSMLFDPSDTTDPAALRDVVTGGKMVFAGGANDPVRELNPGLGGFLKFLGAQWAIGNGLLSPEFYGNGRTMLVVIRADVLLTLAQTMAIATARYASKNHWVGFGLVRSSADAAQQFLGHSLSAFGPAGVFGTHDVPFPAGSLMTITIGNKDGIGYAYWDGKITSVTRLGPFVPPVDYANMAVGRRADATNFPVNGLSLGQWIMFNKFLSQREIIDVHMALRAGPYPGLRDITAEAGA